MNHLQQLNAAFRPHEKDNRIVTEVKAHPKTAGELRSHPDSRGHVQLAPDGQTIWVFTADLIPDASLPEGEFVVTRTQPCEGGAA